MVSTRRMKRFQWACRHHDDDGGVRVGKMKRRGSNGQEDGGVRMGNTMAMEGFE